VSVSVASTVQRDASCDLTVVAIGASAGGLNAITQVLSALVPDLPAAVIVVLHLDPRARSRLAHLLSRESRLPVREAIGGDTLRPGVVYVAPPAAHLVLQGGTLILTHTAPVHFSRPSVDVLFASVATACGPRSVGVILTGAGVDGADGMRAIKAAGGSTIIQEPRSAEYVGMPNAASATGCVDMSLPLRDIGPALATIIGPAKHAIDG
jgi:two-component system, chemotaxis family, protein-glutamate methylesterase/glutaminase